MEDTVQWLSVGCVAADNVCFEEEIIYIQLMDSFPFFP